MPNDRRSNPRQSRSGIFISYSRKDVEFVQNLRQRLESEGFDLWQDISDLPAGRDWRIEIKKALDQVEFMTLVVTPDSIASEIVRWEWRYARQQGVCIFPVKGRPDLNLDSLPRWMREKHICDTSNDLQWQRLVNDLKTQCQAPRVPFMVEDLPEDFVQRPGEFDQLLKLLLDENREEPVAITAALRGAGGYGKTTLAKALCHNEEIQNAFDDGILWVTLGEEPGDLNLKVVDLIVALSGQKPDATGSEALAARLRELLADRDILMVIDDVWDSGRLRPFTQGGERCARLITTRNLETLPGRAKRITVDQMLLKEAAELLTKGLDEHLNAQSLKAPAAVQSLEALAARLGRWPLLVKLVNGSLRDRIVETREPFNRAIDYVNRALDKRGLTHFDVQDSDAREDAVKKTLDASLERLDAAGRERFDSLAIFPEDTDVPLRTLERYWALDDFDADELCGRFYQLSLFANFDRETRAIRLHDVIRKYLIEQNSDRRIELHDRLLNTHLPVSPSPRPSVSSWSALPEDEPYLWDHLAFHLIEAGRDDELVATVKDWRYLAKKTLLKKSLSVEKDLLSAEKIAPADDPLRTLRRNYVNSGYLFNHCETPGDIEATLSARLSHLEELKTILQDLANSLCSLRVTPQFTLPDLPHPALIRTLEGHHSGVNGCAFSPDGKLIVSASDDDTLRVWEAQTGETLRTLEGHSAGVYGCAFSPDGRLIVSASNDRTLRVWDAQSSETLRTLEGHSEVVKSCAFSPDGKLTVSASYDRTLRVWDAQSGGTLHVLIGHFYGVSDCAFSPDGSLIVSASYDDTLRVWDAQSGKALRVLEGHSSWVSSCAFSPDGRLIVSASNDGTLRVWDAQSGKTLRVLEGQFGGMCVCAFSPDGRLIVSASDNHTLRVWDAQTGETLRTLKGHFLGVSSCAFSPNGRLIVSASYDRTLRVWDAQSGETLRKLEVHSDFVNGCAFSPDGKLIVSASRDRTLRVWSLQTGECKATFHADGDMYCCVMHGEMIVAGGARGVYFLKLVQ